MEKLQQLQKRTYGLDIFRAVAILLVVHGHGKFMLRDTFLQDFPWIRLIDGVELFFVLSGFLIGTLLLKIIHRNNYRLSAKDILIFWKRRWFRTLPNYYLILIVNVFLVRFAVIDNDFDQFSFKYFVFFQNFHSPLVGFFWESWSLAIEEWFYIFLPLGLFIILLIQPNSKGIFIVIISLIIIPLIYRILQSGEQVDFFWWDVKFRKVVLMRLDTIIYGVLAAYVKFYFKDFWVRIKIPSLVIGLIIISFVVYLDQKPNSLFAKVFYFNVITIATMLLLPFFDSIPNYKTKIGKMLTHISLISYSMYLVNLALVAQVIQKQFPVTSPQNGLIKYFIYWIIVILLSTILYRYFEKPVMDLREKKLWSGFKSQKNR